MNKAVIDFIFIATSVWRLPSPIFSAILVSHRPPGGESRSPCPLKIEAAQLAGNVHNFSNEIQTGNLSCFHGLRRQFTRIDATEGYFGFSVPLSPLRYEMPLAELIRGVQVVPCLNETPRQDFHRFVVGKEVEDDW